MKKVIYIASPYTVGDMAENVAVQLEAAHKLMDMGHCPVAPLLSHYLSIHRRRPYQEWIDTDLALIPKMDIVLRLPGFSKGADGEVDLAKELKIPVCFGWEELESYLKAPVEITINGEKHLWKGGDKITYEDICGITGNRPEYNPTVAYHDGSGNTEGCLTHGKFAVVKKGTNIACYNTGNA